MSWDVGAWVINTLKKLIETHGTQTFTANGTFTVPAGVHKIFVTACGGGQGGGSYVAEKNWIYSGKGGDGGECILREAFSVTPGKQLSITVGAGGAKGSYEIGSNGGATIVGDLITLKGGGTASNLIGAGVGGGKGGYYSSTNNYPATKGGNGARGNGGLFLGTSSSAQAAGGSGGGSYGNGGDGANGATAATAPGYGGGGGGGGNNSTAGTAGGKGIVIIEW